MLNTSAIRKMWRRHDETVDWQIALHHIRELCNEVDRLRGVSRSPHEATTGDEPGVGRSLRGVPHAAWPRVVRSPVPSMILSDRGESLYTTQSPDVERDEEKRVAEAFKAEAMHQGLRRHEVETDLVAVRAALEPYVKRNREMIVWLEGNEAVGYPGPWRDLLNREREELARSEAALSRLAHA